MLRNLHRELLTEVLHVLHPVMVILLRKLRDKTLQNLLYVSDYLSIYYDILIYLGRIYIDLDDFCIRGKGLRISKDSV